MNQAKKIITISLFLAVFVFAGFGCKGLTAEQQAATQPINLEYWTVADDVDAINALIGQYKVSRPYLNITLRQLSAGELYQRLIEALAEDRGPDIISINSRVFPKFLSKLAPMPGLVSDTTVQVIKGQLGTTTNVSLNSVVMPTVLDIDRNYIKTVKKDVVFDNRIYGLPLSMDTMALYYNKDLLDKAGVAEPPKTWTDFQDAVKKSSRFNKQTNKITQAGVAMGVGSNIPGFDDLLYILFRQSNVNMVDANGRAIFNLYGDNNDNPTESVLNFFSDYANSTRDTYTWNESLPNALDNFINGASVFYFGYSYDLPVIQARGPQINLGILPIPQLDPEASVNVANYWIQSVVGKSTKQNEAWGLINFLAYSSANKSYLDATGRPTALRAYINAQKGTLELLPFVEQLLVADNWYRGTDYDAAKKALSDMLHNWLQAPPEDDLSVSEWHQNLMNIAAETINQTL